MKGKVIYVTQGGPDGIEEITYRGVSKFIVTSKQLSVFIVLTVHAIILMEVKIMKVVVVKENEQEAIVEDDADKLIARGQREIRFGAKYGNPDQISEGLRLKAGGLILQNPLRPGEPEVQRNKRVGL